jgi:hypothetical protein
MAEQVTTSDPTAVHTLPDLSVTRRSSTSDEVILLRAEDTGSVTDIRQNVKDQVRDDEQVTLAG